MSTFNTIKKHPVILSAVGFTTATACLYQGKQYENKSKDLSIFITNLNDREKALINDSIATPLRNLKPINVSLNFYNKIHKNNMSRLGKATLIHAVEEYNTALEEQRRLNQYQPGQRYGKFQKTQADLYKFIRLLNDNRAAISHVEKIEQYGDRCYILAAICGVASLIPLAIAYK
jgi:hypothetical protein